VGQSIAVTLATFAAVGIGMALPYALLSAFPKLVDHVPRTGPASDLVKQMMGLLMLAAAAFFLGTGLSGALSSPPDPPGESHWWVVGAFIAAAGVWLAWRTWRITSAPARRALSVIAGAVMVTIGVYLGDALTRPSPVQWIYYTPERLSAARQQGKVIVLDFTAIWCLNCKALEEAVLHRSEVAAALNAATVAPVKVDITSYEPAQRKLDEVGSKTIPLLIVYDTAGQEIFRSDAYTPQQVLDALSRAAGAATAGISATTP
jgi:thiol:disulfide interchange protein